jgi:hypothetical protein
VQGGGLEKLVDALMSLLMNIYSNYAGDLRVGCSRSSKARPIYYYTGSDTPLRHPIDLFAHHTMVMRVGVIAQDPRRSEIDRTYPFIRSKVPFRLITQKGWRGGKATQKHANDADKQTAT